MLHFCSVKINREEKKMADIAEGKGKEICLWLSDGTLVMGDGECKDVVHLPRRYRTRHVTARS